MKSTFTLAVALVLGLVGYSQYYYVPQVTNGNPGGLNTDGEYPSGSGLPAGWTSLVGPSVGTPTWSASQTIPFTFNFNGAPVTNYVVSSTGVLTFDVAGAGTAPGNTPASLPSASIPDQSVCVWGIEASGSNDRVMSKTFGSAGSQQHWIFFTSMSVPGNTTWHYWAIVLEEGTDDIYVMDMRNSGTTALTIGIQIDGTTATEVAGSPAVDAQSGTDPTDVDNYYYHFIQGTQPNEDVAGVAMTTFQYQVLGNAPYDIEGDVMNLGAATINTMDINYSVNGGATVTESLTGLSIAPFASYSFTHGTQWNPGATGNYTVEIWASNINGNPDANTNNDVASGPVDVFNAFTQRVPLYETFTSSTCGPCVAGNQNLEGLFALSQNNGKWTSVKYQSNFPGNGDPYCTDESTARRNFYSINSIPRLEIDGGWDSNAASLTQQVIDDYYAIPSFVDLTATYSINGQTVSVDVDIDPVETFGGNNLALHMAVIEYTTYNNTGSNGETEFAHVMKKMLPDEDGTSISSLVSGVNQSVQETYTFQGSYVLPPDANSPINHATEHSVEEFSDLGVAVWVQDLNTLEVYQSAMASLVTGIEGNEQLLTAKLYPNPVQDQATLAFQLKDGGNVDVVIYNNFGQAVMSNTYTGFAPGRSVIDLNLGEMANGLYTVVLTSGKERITKKMTISK